MAKATTLIDDMDGSPGATERHFSIGGIDYSIDLNDANWQAFLLTMEPWRSLASVARKPRKQAHRPLTAHERKTLRTWAQYENIDLPARGRFPNKVVERFLKDQQARQELTEAEYAHYAHLR